MALSVSDIESELNTVVNEATSVVDLVDKYADVLGKFAGQIPGVGDEVETVIGYLDKATKALDELKAALAGG